MSIPTDPLIGTNRGYPVPPIPTGTDATRNNTAAGPDSFQSLLKRISDSSDPPAKPLDSRKSSDKDLSLLEFAQRVKLQMNESLLRIVSDTETENHSRNPLMDGIQDILSEGANSRSFSSIIRHPPSETGMPHPEGLAPNYKKTAETLPPAPGTRGVDEIIREAAETYDVAPELIRSVIQAESNFNPNAISPKGAGGLMQLMPMTARELGVTDPLDPVSNVMGGTRYLKKLLDRYNGSVPLALAAYNWGMGNLDSNRGRMPEETRNYVAKITKAYRESTNALA